MSGKSVIIDTKQGLVGVSKASSECGPNEENVEGMIEKKKSRFCWFSVS